MSKIASLLRSQLLGLQPGSFTNRLDEQDVRAIIAATDSFWVRPKDAAPEVPHAELTAGDCSDGFINLRIVLSYWNLCEIFAQQLVALLRDHTKVKIDWVVGSHTAATGLSKDVARLLRARWYPMQKTDAGQILSGVRIPDGSNVVRIEELITTAKTVRSVTTAALCNNPDINLIDCIPVVVHRPEGNECDEIDGAKVLYLAHFDIGKWKPAVCPHCAKGSPRLRPNNPENWQQLVDSVA